MKLIIIKWLSERACVTMNPLFNRAWTHYWLLRGFVISRVHCGVVLCLWFFYLFHSPVLFRIHVLCSGHRVAMHFHAPFGVAVDRIAYENSPRKKHNV